MLNFNVLAIQFRKDLLLSSYKKMRHKKIVNTLLKVMDVIRINRHNIAYLLFHDLYFQTEILQTIDLHEAIDLFSLYIHSL